MIVHMVFGSDGYEAVALRVSTLVLVQCRQMGWKFTTEQGTQMGPSIHTRTITNITSEITNLGIREFE